MVSLALGTSNGVEANNGINDLSPAPEAKKNGSELCYKISVVAALVLGLLAAAGGAVVLALFCTFAPPLFFYAGVVLVALGAVILGVGVSNTCSCCLRSRKIEAREQLILQQKEEISQLEQQLAKALKELNTKYPASLLERRGLRENLKAWQACCLNLEEEMRDLLTKLGGYQERLKVLPAKEKQIEELKAMLEHYSRICHKRGELINLLKTANKKLSKEFEKLLLNYKAHRDVCLGEKVLVKSVNLIDLDPKSDSSDGDDDDGFNYGSRV